ncbi:hypothetical protein QBC34DRAFT_419092 [Podospora aff. communis PSN243]|uniref:Uncharacterized protein n=1 Tax=Podospora aff. communis PSN243 TaxID=3040156 RepID=A0AAV9FY61_9PEZI|nr:hypothetical protein QBC34DRAFT_419092 [Podospora aff. communis PSN243]
MTSKAKLEQFMALLQVAIAKLRTAALAYLVFLLRFIAWGKQRCCGLRGGQCSRSAGQLFSIAFQVVSKQIASRDTVSSVQFLSNKRWPRQSPMLNARSNDPLTPFSSPEQMDSAAVTAVSRATATVLIRNPIAKKPLSLGL